jgi:predicted RNA binding protein YcfA (HicA-like mRNA interferase family)
MQFRSPSTAATLARFPFGDDGVKVSEILKILRQDGWVQVATRGSHRQFKHPSKPGRVTVPGKPSKDLHPATLNSILKQAGLK